MIKNDNEIVYCSTDAYYSSVVDSYFNRRDIIILVIVTVGKQVGNNINI